LLFRVFNCSPNGTETEPIAACRELPKSLTLSADEIIREPSWAFASAIIEAAVRYPMQETPVELSTRITRFHERVSG